MNVHIGFVLNCPKLATTLTSFNCEWIHKLWYIHTMKYYSAIKSNELLIHTATWKNLNCIMPSEKSQTQKTTYSMISFTWHSRKGKLLGQKTEQMLSGAGDEGGADYKRV